MTDLSAWFKTSPLAKLPIKLPIKRWVGKVNALPQRDRIALLGGGLALIVGFEFQAVLPIHDRRAALLASQPGQDPLQEQNDRLALEKKQAELQKLQQVLAGRSPLESNSTEAGSPREVFAALRQAMALQEVEVVSLKALPDSEPIKAPDAVPAAATEPDATAVAEAASEVVADVAAAAAPEAPAASEPSVYRHRAELKVVGTVAHVNQVLKQFEQGKQLLRLERVRLTPAQNTQQIEATLSLVLISQEQTWLAM